MHPPRWAGTQRQRRGEEYGYWQGIGLKHPHAGGEVSTCGPARLTTRATRRVAVRHSEKGEPARIAGDG